MNSVKKFLIAAITLFTTFGAFIAYMGSPYGYAIILTVVLYIAYIYFFDRDSLNDE